MLLQCLRSLPWRCGRRRGPTMTYGLQSGPIRGPLSSRADVTVKAKWTVAWLLSETLLLLGSGGMAECQRQLRWSLCGARRLSGWVFIVEVSTSLGPGGGRSRTGAAPPGSGWSSPAGWVRQPSVGLLRPDTEPWLVWDHNRRRFWSQTLRKSPLCRCNYRGATFLRLVLTNVLSDEPFGTNLDQDNRRKFQRIGL